MFSSAGREKAPVVSSSPHAAEPPKPAAKNPPPTPAPRQTPPAKAGRVLTFSLDPDAPDENVIRSMYSALGKITGRRGGRGKRKPAPAAEPAASAATAPP